MNLKILEKSRKLLVQVMGEEDFNKFIEDGKIEIKHGEGKKEIVYELDQDGRVFNRTKEQSYCIEPIVPDSLPLHDQLAIKYGYLKNNVKRVEEVANKRSLNPFDHGIIGGLATRFAGTGDVELNLETRTRQSMYGHMGDRRPDYNSYVEYMESSGWRRTQVTLDERNHRLVTTNGVKKNEENIDGNNNYNNQVIDIRCPAGQKISIMGVHQVPRGVDTRVAHSLRARIADNEDNEIPFDTRIRITKIRPSTEVVQIARIFYGDINLTKQSVTSDLNPINLLIYKTDNEWYKFHQGIEINGEEHLEISVIDSVNIDARHVRLALDCDIWSM